MTKFYSDPIQHSSKVCMVSVTPDAEKHMGYVARVSNPKNQDNPEVAGLLKSVSYTHLTLPTKLEV